MEQLLNSIQPALILASDRMIEMVDRVIERNIMARRGDSRHNMLAWFYGMSQQASLNHQAGL